MARGVRIDEGWRPLAARAIITGMRVVIMGAGEVGAFLALRLRGEAHDIVVIESDADRARQLGEHLDVQLLVGARTWSRAASPNCSGRDPRSCASNRPSCAGPPAN